MKKLFLSLLFVFSSLLFALEITPAYQIVLPAKTENAALNAALYEAASTLRDVLKRQLKTMLPIRYPETAKAGVPSIRIGGADPQKLRCWEYRIEVQGNDLLLYGRDLPGINSKAPWYDWEQVEVGSAKAVAEFLERFCGTAFLMPGKAGVSVDVKAKIAVPDDFKSAVVPAIPMVGGLYRRPVSAMMYMLSLNCFPLGRHWKSYGGHSHDEAIPYEMRREHPEYFALMWGKRGSRPKHCLSNPKVRELIYAELLKQCDLGYDMVQIGQSDGSGHCGCEACKTIFGVSDHGEQLWLFHRDMAERLLKERPGVKVTLLAYGATKVPPQSFKKFPANVAVELAPSDPQYLARWKGYEIPHGFGAYLYQWGPYRPEGFTPCCTLRSLCDQARYFRKNDFRFIWICRGRGIPGLEGPGYYLWGKLLGDPKQDEKALFKDYCRRAFGAGAEEMEKFFGLLDSRCALDLKNRSDDWHDDALLQGKVAASPEKVELIKRRFTPQVCAELEKLLAEAEKKAGKNSYLPLVRVEWDYLRTLAEALYARDRYRLDCSDANFELMSRAFTAHDQVIDALPRMPNQKSERAGYYTPELRYFAGETIATLKKNGDLRASLPPLWPLGSDFEWWQAEKINPGRRIIRADGTFQYLIQNNLWPQRPEIRRYYRKFAVRSNEKNVIIEVRFGGLTAQEAEKESVGVYLGSGEKRILVLAKTLVPLKVWSGKRVKLSAENQHKGDAYENASVRAKFKMLPPDAEGVPGVGITIPLRAVGGKAPEMELNLISEGKKTLELRYIWNFNPGQLSWREARDRAGKLLL